MNGFEVELGKYYRQTPGKIIFNNGSTLNQLANDIWEDLGYKNMDPSSLSRILKGERLFTFEQLSSFCKILKLTDSESKQLHEKLTLEKNARLKIPILKDTPYIDIEFANNYINQIHSVTRTGNPKIAMAMSENLNEWLSRRINSTETIELILKSSLEESIAKNIIFKPKEYLKFAKNKSNFLFKISHKKVDKKYTSYIYFLLAIANYINKNHKASIHNYKKALELMEDPNLRIHSLRDICIEYTNLGEFSEFKKAEKLLLAEIEKGQFTDINEVCCAYEGIARSERFMNESKATALLHKANKIYEDKIKGSNNLESVIKIQLLKSESEIYKATNPNDKNLIRRPALQALEVSKANQYERYTKNLIDLINSI